MSDTILLLLTICYIFLTTLIPVLLKLKNKISGYVARKLIHSFTGLSVFIVAYLNNPFLAVYMSLSVAILMLFARPNSASSLLKTLYNTISEDNEQDVGYLQGPFAYAVAITLTLLIIQILPARSYFAIAALVTMIFADTAASIIGKKYGKHKITTYFNTKRTLEGSTTYFIVGIISCLIVYTFVGHVFTGNTQILSLNSILLLSILTSLTSTLLELFSPGKWDDLITPVGTTVLLILISGYV